MNLHQIVRGAIGAINPEISATLLASTGYAIAPGGKRTAAYTAYEGVMIQVQAVAGKDLEHVNNLNLQGVLRSVHLNGNWNGVVRPDGKGGDIMQFPLTAGGTLRDWLIVNVVESWPDWTHVIVQLQDGAATPSPSP